MFFFLSVFYFLQHFTYHPCRRLTFFVAEAPLSSESIIQARVENCWGLWWSSQKPNAFYTKSLHAYLKNSFKKYHENTEVVFGISFLSCMEAEI